MVLGLSSLLLAKFTKEYKVQKSSVLQSSRNRGRLVSGGIHGLQNRCRISLVRGGFDSHAPPPYNL